MGDRIVTVVDSVVREGVTQRRRAELRDALAARGLSDEELNSLAPYVDYVARHAGVAWVLPVLFVPTIVGGVVAAVTLPVSPPVALALTGGLVLAVAVAARRFYRRVQRARRIRRELLADPEPFLEGEPPLHLIAGG